MFVVVCVVVMCCSCCRSLTGLLGLLCFECVLFGAFVELFVDVWCYCILFYFSQ